MERERDRAATGWLIATVRRAGREARRRLSGRFREDPHDPDGPVLSHLEGLGCDPAQRLVVGDLLQALPHRERAVIILTVLQGRTQKDIAARLNISQSRVSQLRKSGLRRLQDVIEEGKDDGGPG